MKQSKDPFAQLLDEEDLPYELRNVPLNKINERVSRSNQVRSAQNTILEDLVEQYARDMKTCVFPPIVVHPVGSSFVILDGNNRHQAAVKNGESEIAAYVIGKSLTDHEFHDLAPRFNLRNGQSLTEEERIEHGKRYVRISKHTIPAAAALVGISTGRLSSALHAEDVHIRLDRAGTPPKVVRALSEGHLDALYAIKNDVVLRAAAQRVELDGMTVTETRALAGQLRQAPSEEAAKDLLAARDVSKEVGKAVRRQKSLMTPWYQTKGHLSYLANLADPVGIVAGVPREERGAALKLLVVVTERVLSMSAAL